MRLPSGGSNIVTRNYRVSIIPRHSTSSIGQGAARLVPLSQQPPAELEAGTNEWLKAILAFGRRTNFGGTACAVRAASVTFPPHPSPLPRGEGESSAVFQHNPAWCLPDEPRE